VLIESTRHTDDGVELEQCERRRRIVQVGLTAPELLAEPAGQCIDVDLQPDAECGRRAQTGSDTAVLRTGDRLVEMELAAPEILVAEGVVAKDLPPLADELASAVDDGVVEVVVSLVAGGAERLPQDEHPHGECCAEAPHAAAPTRRAAGVG
jgi:hypothetical protein